MTVLQFVFQKSPEKLAQLLKGSFTGQAALSVSEDFFLSDCSFRVTFPMPLFQVLAWAPPWDFRDPDAADKTMLKGDD